MECIIACHVSLQHFLCHNGMIVWCV